MKVLYLSTNGDNTITLPNPLQVQGYYCAIIEMNGKLVHTDEIKKRNDLYLCSDICEESCVNDIKMPVLRKINRSRSGGVSHPLFVPIWLKVLRPNIESIRLYISKVNGEPYSVEDNILNCTLVFIEPDSSCL